jgi:hypothetical protein
MVDGVARDECIFRPNRENVPIQHQPTAKHDATGIVPSLYRMGGVQDINYVPSILGGMGHMLRLRKLSEAQPSETQSRIVSNNGHCGFSHFNITIRQRTLNFLVHKMYYLGHYFR